MALTAIVGNQFNIGQILSFPTNSIQKTESLFNSVKIRCVCET